MYIFITSPSLLLTMRNVSDKSCSESRGNQNKQRYFQNFFLNPTIYEIMWKNMVEPDRPQVIILAQPDTQDYRHALRLRNIIAFPLQQLLPSKPQWHVCSYIASFIHPSFNLSFIIVLCKLACLLPPTYNLRSSHGYNTFDIIVQIFYKDILLGSYCGHIYVVLC